MEPIKDQKSEYLKKLKDRNKESRAYTSYQHLGLEIAKILDDWEHRSLYIRLARDYNPDTLLRLAKSVAEREHVSNLGAYFMKVLEKHRKESRL